jgi:hypothetical protein
MKGKPAKPGVGSGMQNSKSIATEKPQMKNIGSGLPKTYFGNSRSIDSERSKK